MEYPCRVRSDRHRLWPWLFGLVLIVMGAWLCAAEDDSGDPEIAALLRELAARISAPSGDDPAERATRIAATVAAHVAPGAVLEIEEMPELGGDPEQLAAALIALVAPGETAVVELMTTEIRRLGAASAAAWVDVRVGGDVGRDLHARQRRLTLRLEHDGARWQIVAAAMPARADPEPEPRP